MKDKTFRTKILILLSFITIFNGYVLGDITHWRNNKITERPMRAEIIQKIGSDKGNERFLKPRSFAIDRNGRIFILDSGNSRVQCFSKDGKFQFSFGRAGQGPGELTDRASNIKILDDGNIYVIDKMSQYRINAYSAEGKFLFFGTTKGVYYDDVVLLNKTYYLSRILLQEDFQPIDICRTLGKVDGSFGVFIDPAIGLSREVSHLPNPEPWVNMFIDSNFTNLIVDNKNEIIFSQQNPYRLIKYDSGGRVLKDTVGDVDFDTQQHCEFTVGKDGSVSVSWPSAARIFHMSLKGDNQLIVPFLDPEKDFFFIDIYDLDLNLISRHKMPYSLVDPRKKEYLNQVIIDDNNNLFCLVVSKEYPPQLVKYKLIFDTGY